MTTLGETSPMIESPVYDEPDPDSPLAQADTNEPRLIPYEVETLLTLYQQMNAMKSRLFKGEEPLVLPHSTVLLMTKAHHIYYNILKKKPGTKGYWGELLQLLEYAAKVQFVCVIGNQPSLVPDAGTRTAEEAALEEAARRHVFQLDVRVFAKALRTLHIKHMDVKNKLLGVGNVVELIITDSTFECGLDAFNTLRSIQYDRSTINPKSLGALSYSIRSFSSVLYQRNVEAPLWRGPAPEDAIEDLNPWEALSHVRIVRSRVPVRLDPSWDQLVNLMSLTVTHVQMSSLTTLNVVSKCMNLAILDVSHNKIDKLTALTTVGPNLVKLNIAYNRLTTCAGIGSLSKLKELNVEGNDIQEWCDIREVADGCKHLTSIALKGNPIATRFKPEKDIVPFTASIFRFRSLTVDGQSTSGAKRTATSEFIARYLPLFERAAPIDANHEVQSARGSMYSYQQGGRGPASDAGSIGNMSYSRNRSMSQAQSHRHRSSSRHHSERHSKGPKARPMQVDRTALEAELPPDPSLIPDSPDDAIFRRLDPQQLKEKYGDNWQEQAATLAQSAYRDFEGLPPPKPDTPRRTRKSKEPKERRRKHKSHHHHKEEAEASPDPVSTHAVSSVYRGLSEENDRLAVQKAQEMRAALRNAKLPTDTGSAVPRKDAPPPPPGTFSSLLDSLLSEEWHHPKEKKKHLFTTTPSLTFTSFTVENDELWGIDEDAFRVPGTAIEVTLHDSSEKIDKVKHRFDGKVLFRVTEHSTGGSKYIRLQSKLGPKTPTGISGPRIPDSEQFGRPAVTVAMGLREATQPLSLKVESMSIAEAQASTMMSGGGRKTGGGLFSSSLRASNTEVAFEEFGDSNGGGQRPVHEMEKPRFLAAFVIPAGPIAQVFAEFMIKKLKNAHSRLCVAGITHVWPRTMDEGSTAEVAGDRQIPVKMTTGFIKEHCTTYKTLDLARQRTGSSLAIKGDDLFLTLQSYVWDSRTLSKDRCRLITYTSVLMEAEDRHGDIVEWEEAMLVVITKSEFCTANDRNLTSKQQQASRNPGAFFPESQQTNLAALTDVEVDWDLQAVKLLFLDDLKYIIKTRDSSTTLGIVNALMTSDAKSRIAFNVRPCRLGFVLAAPLVFSVAAFLRPLNQKAAKKTKEDRAYPLRETKEDMMACRFLLTSSEVCLVRDFDMDEPIETDETKLAYSDRKMKLMELARRPLTSIKALRVAGSDLFPLVFGLELNAGGKKEIWALTAQHPNTIALVHDQIKAQCPKAEIVEITAAQHENGN